MYCRLVLFYHTFYLLTSAVRVFVEIHFPTQSKRAGSAPALLLKGIKRKKEKGKKRNNHGKVTTKTTS